ncbi:MAG: carboxypeptidase-like regulatory domain-containing protein [Flavobacteriales bacterium]|nr:carboxypeptidase-like regulatory domain-containing protein [Flavobacteriales bacterium]
MKTITLIALALLNLGLYAQNTFGEIKGKVFEADTKEPIIGANVFVMANGELVGAQTDINGKFTIKPLASGTYDLHIKYIGMQEVVMEGLVVRPDEITFADDVNMQSGEVLTTLIVKPKEKLIQAETHNKVTIGGKEIRNSPVKQNLAMIAVGTGQVSTSADGGEIYFRGARAGDAVYLIDGVKVTGATPAIPSSGIKSFSVYSGGLPAKYGDTMGGVIVVETKSYFDLYYESLRD